VQALTSSLASGMQEPVQSAFRETFEEVLVPAFEAACQDMFAQISRNLASGLQQHAKSFAQGKTTAKIDAKLGAMNKRIDQLSVLTKSVETLAESVKQLAAAAQTNAAAAESRAASQAASAAAAAAAGTGGQTPAVKEEVAGCNAVGEKLKEKDYQGAFWSALNAQSKELVAWTCRQTNPIEIVKKVDQLVLLSLIQQLGSEMSRGEGFDKLAWLMRCAVEVDLNNAQIGPHVPRVFDAITAMLENNVAEFGSDASYVAVLHLYRNTSKLSKTKQGAAAAQ
jgi:enhancer of mRNA-decapping protein 4